MMEPQRLSHIWPRLIILCALGSVCLVDENGLIIPVVRHCWTSPASDPAMDAFHELPSPIILEYFHIQQPNHLHQFPTVEFY